MDSILVTGGAGFIGSNFVRQWLAEEANPLVNLDKLTYAGNLDSLAELPDDPRYVFVRGDICDGPLVSRLLEEHREHTDHFAFVGPGDFKLHLWDARGGSTTFGHKQALVVGESNRQAVIVPPGVVHAYQESESTGAIP